MRSGAVVLWLALVCFFLRADAEGRTSRRSLPGTGHAATREELSNAFNELVHRADRLYAEFKSDAVAVNEARTAFLLCAECYYSGPELHFLNEMYGIDQLVDRKYIVDEVFPALEQHSGPAPVHLWIGVKPYSLRYEYLLRSAGVARFDTIEPDPLQALYGSTQNHFVDIAQNIDKYVGPETYNVVIGNGVLGWGIDSQAQIAEFYFTTARVMKPGGILVIGYNPHIGANHTLGIEEHFEKATLGSLPQKMQFDIEWKHVYEIYRKKSAQVSHQRTLI